MSAVVDRGTLYALDSLAAFEPNQDCTFVNGRTIQPSCVTDPDAWLYDFSNTDVGFIGSYPTQGLPPSPSNSQFIWQGPSLGAAIYTPIPSWQRYVKDGIIHCAITLAGAIGSFASLPSAAWNAIRDNPTALAAWKAYTKIPSAARTVMMMVGIVMDLIEALGFTALLPLLGAIVGFWVAYEALVACAGGMH